MPKTLLEQIEDIEFSESAGEMFVDLTRYSAADEAGAVIVVAAAVLLAREFPDRDPADQNRLVALTSEFAEVVLAARDRLASGRCRPGLRLVGGRNA